MQERYQNTRQAATGHSRPGPANGASRSQSRQSQPVRTPARSAEFATLERDLVAHGVHIPPRQMARLRDQCTEVIIPARAVVDSQGRVAQRWLFLSSGIAASEQSTEDGKVSIGRFFEPMQICANVTSAWHARHATDDLVAITTITGVSIPDYIFRSEYLEGGPFGRYLRLKAMETLLFDKELICAKTISKTEVRYRFLEERHTSIIGQVSQKDIARFLGITPQGLSRFLKTRRTAPGNRLAR